MKKLISILFLVAAFAVCGSVNAFAQPVVDGTIGSVATWTNSDAANGGAPYPYYLDIVAPPATNDAISTMVMSHVVLLQDLDATNPAKDGIYLLIQVQTPGPQLIYPNPALYPSVPHMTNEIGDPPQVEMTGDFAGQGVANDVDIFVDTLNSNPFGATDNPALDVTTVCVGTEIACANTATWQTLQSYSGTEARDPLTGVLEYFFPSALMGALGSTPFPDSFIGTIIFHNGISSTQGVGSGDDVVVGTLAPEPSTMFLMLAGFLGLFSRKRFGL